MLIRLNVLVAALLLLTPAAPVAAQTAGDAANGEKEFPRRCGICHSIGGSPKRPTGPDLTGVVGRKAGTTEGYAYSPLNKAAGEAGLTWTEDHVFEYVANPTEYLKKFLTEAGKPDQIKGMAKMVPPAGMKDEKLRRDVIAYLKSKS
jgi:cytochrome c